MLPLAGIFQTLASLLAVAIVLGFIAYGFMHGMFRSVLAGMQALVSFVVTLTYTPMITEVLIAVDMPPSYAFPIAVLILLIGTTVGVHILIEKFFHFQKRYQYFLHYITIYIFLNYHLLQLIRTVYKN